MLRSAFLIVIACHIPFVFFAGKEAFLLIIDELHRKVVSANLEARIKNGDKESRHGSVANEIA